MGGKSTARTSAAAVCNSVGETVMNMPEEY